MVTVPSVLVFPQAHPNICWSEGSATRGEPAIHLEQLWNVIAARYDVDILCAHSLRSRDLMDDDLFGRICAEHSAVHAL
jgi:hypothetical protein